MSRFEVLHEDKGLAFGNDHACGEFLMIWTRSKEGKKRQQQDIFGPDADDILVDKDVLFDPGFNREEMGRLIKEHGFEIEELMEVVE